MPLNLLAADSFNLDMHVLLILLNDVEDFEL